MIYIIRHGQTGLNKAKLLQGRSDTALNEKGKEQAEKAFAFFEERGIHFEHVFSSPLIRARETAEICAPETEPVIDERLIEMDYGPYEGCNLENPPAEIIEFFSDFVHNPAPAGMEQLSDVVKRAGSFLEDIRSLEGNILISTHAIAMKGLLECLTPESNGSYWSRYIGNCSVYSFENRNRVYTVPEEIY